MMAMAAIWALITMGAFGYSPPSNIVAENPQMGTICTNPEAKGQETIEIRSRLHHHPFSSQQETTLTTQKPHLKRATQQLNNTKKKATNHGNKSLTRDECVHLFTTLTAPMVEAMKLRTESLLLASKKMKLAAQQAQAALKQEQQKQDAFN